MKKLIAISILAFSGNALAFDASWDAHEFYAGDTRAPIASGITVGTVEIDDNLYVEGNFPSVTPGSAGPVDISDTVIQSGLYEEGNFAV